jgi:hypothetical protein
MTQVHAKLLAALAALALGAASWVVVALLLRSVL